jgi:pyruvate dehydrogenase kinase 2/3/4
MQDHSLALSELPEIHSFLDGFYLSRIGIRILIGQHISLHEEPREGYIGAINTQCDPFDVAQQAIS